MLGRVELRNDTSPFTGSYLPAMKKYHRKKDGLTFLPILMAYYLTRGTDSVAGTGK